MTMKNKNNALEDALSRNHDLHDALDWALTYLQDIIGSEIENNEDFQEAVKILERN